MEATTILTRGGYTLVEEVTTPLSGFETVGLLYADLVAYLSARIETISSDVELFEEIPPELFEHNAKVKKLKSSTELIGRIKKLDRHVIDGPRRERPVRASIARCGAAAKTTRKSQRGLPKLGVVHDE
jgi:hypothetical protein